MRAVHRVPELLVHQRTALIKQVRGLLGERGVLIAQAVPVALAQCEGDMTSTFQAILIELMEEMRVLEERIARTNQWIAAFTKHSVLCQKIQAIDGVGPVV